MSNPVADLFKENLILCSTEIAFRDRSLPGVLAPRTRFSRVTPVPYQTSALIARSLSCGFLSSAREHCCPQAGSKDTGTNTPFRATAFLGRQTSPSLTNINIR